MGSQQSINPAGGAQNTAADQRPTVAVVGLGLIGGSLISAYKDSGFRILGEDRDETVVAAALEAGELEARLTREALGSCDLVWIALYPQATIEYLQGHMSDFGERTVVIDCCGVKQGILDSCQPQALACGRILIGGHPMAGHHRSGFANRQRELFTGASMILVPGRQDLTPWLRDRIEKLLAPLDFGELVYTDAQTHDAMIAFTSQLAHVVSNAYIKSPTASSHRGFSAGSYRDLTRVAWLNEQMWASLMMENRQPLLTELQYLLSSLQAYEQALQSGDEKRLRRLLLEGKLRKKEVDGSDDQD